MKIAEKPWGHLIENEKFTVVFGNRNGTEEVLRKAFPALSWHSLRQTHSDKIFEVSEKNNEQFPEADAQYSVIPSTALVIKTADCLPIMIYCRTTNRVAAVHAGWRGVVQKLVSKTLQSLLDTGSRKNEFDIFIGPHIQKESFEIGKDVFEQLQNATYDFSAFEKKENNEFVADLFVANLGVANLGEITKAQIGKIAGSANQIFVSDLDTKTNESYWSFRREKSAAGRNLSFIFKRI